MVHREGFDPPLAGPQLRYGQTSWPRKIALRHATGMSHPAPWRRAFEPSSIHHVKSPSFRRGFLNGTAF